MHRGSDLEIIVAAGYGAVIGVIVALVFTVVAWTRKGSLSLKAQRSGVIRVDVPPAEALNRIQAAAPRVKLKVEEVDAVGGRILLSEGLSLTSFGNFLLIAIAPLNGGAEITVGLKPKVPQRGPLVGRSHRRVMERIENAVAGH